MSRFIFKRLARAAIPLLMAFAALPLLAVPATALAAPASAAAGYVYVLNNAAGPNSISTYARNDDGKLTWLRTTAIGGRGLGAPLGSEGSLLRVGNYLFAVDAGSNQVSVVFAAGGALVPLSVHSSGGTDPISLTYSHGRLYVVNAGSDTVAANVAGFWVSVAGTLSAINGSHVALSTANPGPAQVLASPDGRALVVTEKTTNALDVFTIARDGSLSDRSTLASSGKEPFGFGFDPAYPHDLVVSDAGSGAATTYQVTTGHLVKLDGPVADTQVAACWIIISANGKYVYAANAGSGSISGYRFHAGGHLTLLDANGITGATGTGSTPLELGISRDGAFLFALDSGTHTISVFAIHTNGSLTPIAQHGITLPAGAVGLVAA